jgi:hypothetical protein
MTQQDEGEGMRTPDIRFLGQYNFGGSQWSVDLYARDWDEAREKLKAMGAGVIVGSHLQEFPMLPGAGLWVRLVTWWRNRSRG